MGKFTWTLSVIIWPFIEGARTCNVARNAAEYGVSRSAGFDPAALDTTADSDLFGVLAQFPSQVAQAAGLREPHRVARYLESLAAAR